MVTSCEDLLIEIFMLLSVKQFVKLKLVCKHWKSIIFDQLFTVLHAPKHTRLTGLLLGF